MDPIIEKQETEYILNDLLASRPRNDIITEVCWRTKCSWQEGAALLDKVLYENKKFIRQETNPLRLLVSILGIIVGLIWIGVNAYDVSKTLLPWLAQYGSLSGYTLPDSPGMLAAETLVALVMIVIGIVLTRQQLKITRGQGG